MGKIVVDTSEMKHIASANSAIASSVVTLSGMLDHLDGPASQQLRDELEKMLASAETIQKTVDTVIRENK